MPLSSRRRSPVVHIFKNSILFFFYPIQVKPAIIKNDSKDLMIIQASESISLPCITRHGIPSPTLSWWNQTCPKGSSECKPSSLGWRRMTADNASSLLISPSQEHALYKCTAENLLGYDDVIYTVLRQPGKYLVKPLTRIFSFITVCYIQVRALENITS